MGFLAVFWLVAAGAARAQESASDLDPPGAFAPTTPPAGYEVPTPPMQDTGPGRPAAGGEPQRFPSSTSSSRVESSDRIPSRIATRLRVLGEDFHTLATRGGGSIMDGVLSISTGALSITLAAFAVDDAPDNDALRAYLYLYGGAGIGRGIAQLLLVPDPSDSSIAFSHMPMATLDEAQERLAFGETELESLSDQMRLARILDASLNIGAGVALIPVYFGPNDFEFQSAFDYFLIIAAGISVVSGLINLLTESEAERRWEAYQELDERLDREERRR